MEQRTERRNRNPDKEHRNEPGLDGVPGIEIDRTRCEAAVVTGLHGSLPLQSRIARQAIRPRNPLGKDRIGTHALRHGSSHRFDTVRRWDPLELVRFLVHRWWRGLIPGRLLQTPCDDGPS